MIKKNVYDQIRASQLMYSILYLYRKQYRWNKEKYDNAMTYIS